MGITMEKQRAILESVIKEEIDFISYVDLADGTVHTIVTNAANRWRLSESQ